MAGPIIALLLSIQAPSLIPQAPPVAMPGKERPGMAYDPITETYVPIIGWKPPPLTGTVPAGTKMQYNRLGQKVGEVPVRR
ncbi:hypothetical protein HZF05_01970 [Sphingomonas sp. CGMCC 1.13654]|uniref:Uncharacterized protein n=1 Tax=Sphingomonas chungangi TaxID=2683589 RepID=A0A838L0X5_9SPHN|nr:hypothetical protein [Sphingomonas chungangi]MBA2932854.1 hypothetical protein [Sphingomonas chungangi]MVW56475.1 hypothetical protein [Sphingomonas chungangi]